MKQSFIIALLTSLIIILPQNVEAKHHHRNQNQEQMAEPSSDFYGDEELQASIDSVLADTAKSGPEIQPNQWGEEFGNAVKGCVSELEEDSSWFGIFKFAMKGMLLLISILLIAALLISIPYYLIMWIVARFIYRKRHSIARGFNEMENEFCNMSAANPQSANMYNASSEDTSDHYANNAKYMYYWERGIKTTALGLGLFIAGLIWNVNLVMGIGALLGCYGLSQIYISKKYKK